MKNNFRIQGTVATVRNAVPIRFVHHQSMDRPENHALHLNNYLEIYVFVRGNHKYIVENNIYALQRGDIVLINPREVHKALPMEACLYERFYLLVDERCLEGLACNPLSALLSPGCSGENRISPGPEAREQVLQLLYAISACFTNGEDRQTKALGLVLQLLDVCSRLRAGEQPSPDSAAPVPELLEKILAYVAEHTASLQSTSQIAYALGLSPQYLSTYFSRHIGTPLKVYIQAKKIALAKNLLDKGADVTEACYESGFNDCSYFIRIFKKYVGTTPLRYKQRKPDL